MRRAVVLLLSMLPLAAQPAKLSDAQVQTRAAAGDLGRQLRELASSQAQPAWAAYTVPANRARHFGCGEYWRDNEFAVAGGVVHLEPPREALVLIRFYNNQISHVRTLAPGCEISAGGVPFYWLTGVQPAASVSALVDLSKPGGRLAEHAASAIAMHAGAEADAALEKLLAREQPEAMRSAAARWLGTTRGRRGLDALKPVLASDPSEKVRRSAIRSLSSNREPEALKMVIAAADHDPSRDVRRDAISTLRSFPDGQGVPALIQMARAHRDAELRKSAMSALGQSRDPRAVAFFQEILR